MRGEPILQDASEPIFHPPLAGTPAGRDSPIRGRIFSLAALILAVAAAEAIACSIPVFRYALENWRPDPYVAFVLHGDELTADQQALVNRMQSTQFSGTAAANLEVRPLQLEAAEDEFTKKLVEQYGEQPLPQLILRKPGQRADGEIVFSGALTADTASLVMESPLRAEIIQRLIKGDSVVWVYLECGREDTDNEKFAMLQQEIERLQSEIELPEIEEEDLDELAGDPEALEIRFSAVRLSRDDDQESVLREMLLNVESDLKDADYIDEPMAFPVFGRGRALYALVGDGLSPELVEEACRFLAGACQCTVKAENPGVDLMMQVEWDRFITPTEAVDATLPPLAGFTGFGASDDSEQTGMALAENTADVEATPPQPGPPSESDEAVSADSTEEISDVSEADSATGDDPALPAEAAGRGTSSAAAAWKNAMYVLLVAGGGVVVATLLLMRRTSG